MNEFAESLIRISRTGLSNIAAASAATAIGAVEIVRHTRDRFFENHPHAESRFELGEREALSLQVRDVHHETHLPPAGDVGGAVFSPIAWALLRRRRTPE